MAMRVPREFLGALGELMRIQVIAFLVGSSGGGVGVGGEIV